MTTHELARVLLATPDCPAVVGGREVGDVRRVVMQHDAATGEYYVAPTCAKVGRGSALSGFVVDITAAPDGSV